MTKSTDKTLDQVLADIEKQFGKGSVMKLGDHEHKNIDVHVNIKTPDTLHKFINPYVSSTNAARITERVTRVDVSGVGFDVFRINPRTRFNLIFESPIRGMSINQLYRANTIVHTFSNLSSDLFIAQTTMHLCTN